MRKFSRIRSFSNYSKLDGHQKEAHTGILTKKMTNVRKYFIISVYFSKTIMYFLITVLEMLDTNTIRDLSQEIQNGRLIKCDEIEMEKKPHKTSESN